MKIIMPTTSEDGPEQNDKLLACDKLTEKKKGSENDGQQQESENNHKKKQQQLSTVSSPRRKFNRPANMHQKYNNHHHNRSSYQQKRSNSDAKSMALKPTSSSGFNQNDYEKSAGQNQANQQQQKPSDAQRRPIQKTRSITKNGQNCHYESASSSPAHSPTSTSPGIVENGNGEIQLNSADANDASNRKYSIDFLHSVGYKMGNYQMVPHHMTKSVSAYDDNSTTLMAFSDTASYYNQFYTSSVYGNPMIIQPQYQNSYSRTYQQQPQSHQQQQQPLQRMQQQRGYQGRSDNYRLYQQQQQQQQLMYDQDLSVCYHGSLNGQRNYQQSLYSNQTISPSYQNNRKREYHRDNNRRNRNFHNDRSYQQQDGNESRNYYRPRGDYQRNDNNNGNNTAKVNQDDEFNKRLYVRANSDDQQYRSLSPTPPSSSKSSSPTQEKAIEKNLDVNQLHFGSLDLASNASGSTSSLDNLKASVSEPIIIVTPSEENSVKEKSVNVWINSNFSKIYNKLSASAEQLNAKPPTVVVKRPPSINGTNKKSNNQQQQHQQSHQHHHTKNVPVQYDTRYPFEYFLSRAPKSEMRLRPESLRCGTAWDEVSDDMWHKFQAFQQQTETYRSKIMLWKELYNVLIDFPLFRLRAVPKWGLFLVGSTISGFGTENSDVDMCLVQMSRGPIHIDARMEAVMNLSELKNYLTNSNAPFQNFSLINAKVPILRFHDENNKIEVDLNYNNCVGIRNTHLLYCYSQMDWRLRPLALTVKLWARFHNINDARNSTISSYSLVLMVIHFLHSAVSPPVLPCLHTLYPEKFQILHDVTTIDMVEKLNPKWKSENRQSLGELFLRFLDYYSNFDYSRHAISIRTGGLVLIEDCRNVKSQKNDPNHWQTLCIEEPFDLTNTARSAYDCEIFENIKRVFFHSFVRLKETKQLISVFRDPLFTQQTQPQSMGQHQMYQSSAQVKYMIMPNIATSVATASEIKS